VVLTHNFIQIYAQIAGPSGRPRGLRRRSAAALLLRSWVWFPLGAWTFVRCECCVLSGRGLCDGVITSPEEFYWLWRVVVCDLETPKNGETMVRVGPQSHGKNIYIRANWPTCSLASALYWPNHQHWVLSTWHTPKIILKRLIAFPVFIILFLPEDALFRRACWRETLNSAFFLYTVVFARRRPFQTRVLERNCKFRVFFVHSGGTLLNIMHACYQLFAVPTIIMRTADEV